MSEYIDIKNNTHTIIESNCVMDADERKRIEDEIVEELYNIFTKK